MITPQQVGLPAKFSSWRVGQEEIITHMLYQTKRFGVYVVPTGSGKSICYMAAAKMHRGRVLILTSTKGLQDQLAREFGSLVTVVKGKMAYKCRASGNQYWCHTGSCQWGVECPYREDGCTYRDQVRAGARARIVVTNYSFWMAAKPDTLGPFSLIIMDEAHDAPDHLLGALSMSIKKEDMHGLAHFPDKGWSQQQYNEWAKILKGRVDDEVKAGARRKGGGRGHYRILSLQQKLGILDKIWPSNLVVEHQGKMITWDAIWPKGLASPYLFRGIGKVILTSATITRKDCAMMNIAEEDMEFREYPSTFPLNIRKVYFIPTVRMDRFVTNAGMNMWANRIDNIIGGRLGYKGIVHTASYDRAMRISNFSRFRDFMITHTTHNTQEIINKFKAADPPSILVSPSVITGYDFPGDEGRWQIICKVPFPDSRPLVIKARQKMDPDYGCYVAIKHLIQASGRLVRSAEDYGETFIIDSHFQWVFSKYKGLFPKWWVESVITSNMIPEAV